MKKFLREFWYFIFIALIGIYYLFEKEYMLCCVVLFYLHNQLLVKDIRDLKSEVWKFKQDFWKTRDTLFNTRVDLENLRDFVHSKKKKE